MSTLTTQHRAALRRLADSARAADMDCAMEAGVLADLLDLIDAAEAALRVADAEIVRQGPLVVAATALAACQWRAEAATTRDEKNEALWAFDEAVSVLVREVQLLGGRASAGEA